jgi:hypothetical protein
MRSRFAALALGLALAVFPAATHALSFTGTLTVVYLDPSMVVSGPGSGTAGGAGASFDLAGGEFAVAGTSSVPPSFAPGIVQMDVTASNAAGSFAGAGGSMALGGELVHHFFAVDDGAIAIPLSPVGAGGSAPFSTVVFGFAAEGTITGNPWSTDPISIPGLENPLVASGFDDRAPDGTGAVRYLSAFAVELTIGPNTYPALPGYAQLDLVFVPEPATLTLLGAAVAALAGRRLRGRRE